MTNNYEIKNPQNFVAGTVGAPGARIFYLQAHDESLVLTLKVEKDQVQSLASHLAEMLEDNNPASIVSATEMIEPPNAVWTVGAIAIGPGEEAEQIVVVAQELPDQEESEPSQAHIQISLGQAKAIVDHALF